MQRRSGGQARPHDPRADERAAEGRDRARDRRDPQREQAEARQSVPGEARHPVNRELRRARVTGVPDVDDGGLLEADPSGHSPQQTMPLAQRGERERGAPAQQPEVARVERDVEVRRGAQDPVEDRCGRLLEGGLAAPLGSHRADDLEPLAPPCDQLGHDLGRVLQVRVHGDHRVAVGVVEPRRERGGVAEVPRKGDDAHVRGVLRAKRLQGRGRGVEGSVVDVDHLPALAMRGERSRQRCRQTTVELAQDLLLVEDGNDDGVPGGAHRCPWRAVSSCMTLGFCGSICFQASATRAIDA